MNIDFIRVWKDSAYCGRLSDEKSQNLVGLLELGDNDLNTVVGGLDSDSPVDGGGSTVGEDAVKNLIASVFGIVDATSSSLLKS